MLGQIEVGELIRVLEASPEGEPSSRARRIASEFDPGSGLSVAVQSAGPTAETLRFKYSMAAVRGAKVLGLDRLTRTLARLGAARVSGCTVEGTGEFALVFLTEDLTHLIGVVYVAPPGDPRNAPALDVR
ncbi:hypothetical protein [Agromyces sp. GXQ0307]|uniref:hypothetical protein n=1 Tax=Agromyces sp. GXQ0307 TaxID=3377835 RepID=UPI00383AB2FF